MVPLLSAEIDRRASEMVLIPAFVIDSWVRTVTGEGVSTPVRRIRLPVTTISSTVEAPGAA
jgi:hypothetical protein